MQPVSDLEQMVHHINVLQYSYLEGRIAALAPTDHL